MTLRNALCTSSSAAAESLTVANGTRVSLRQVGTGDRAGLAALFDRLTPESRYQRFLSPKHELTPHELTYFTDLDHVNHEAIAAVDERDDSIVGVARYVRHAGRADVAELAIEVADAFQGMGIGTALASLTIHHAHANGFRARAELSARSFRICFCAGFELLLCALDLSFGDAGDASDGGVRVGASDGRFGGGPEAQLVVCEVRFEQPVAMRDRVLVGHPWDSRASQAAANASAAEPSRAAIADRLGLIV